MMPWPVCVPSAMGTQTKSLQLQYEPCRRPPSRAPQVPLKHTAVTCMLWTHPQVTCRPHPGTGDCKDVGCNLGPVPVQADQLPLALAAPSGMQPPQAEAGHPVQRSSATRVPGGTVPGGIAKCAQGDHSGRMPWWDQLLSHWKNAQTDEWPFLLTLNDCTGEGACQEVLPVCHLQGQRTEGSHGKNCSYPSPEASAHPLPVPRARERKGGEGPGGDHPLYLVQPGICYSITDGPDNGQGMVGQFHCPLWAARKRSFQTKGETWKVNLLPTSAGWQVPRSSGPAHSTPNKWPVQEVKLYLNQYARDIASWVQVWLER